MIYAKPNETVRLFVDLPDYATDKYVQAKIYYEGTSSGGSSLCATVNLTHNSSITGRYESLWAAVDGYDRLNIRYITYSDAAYSSIDYGYSITSEQIILNAGGGGGASLIGGYGPVINPLDDEDLKRIKKELSLTDNDIERIAKKIKDKINLDAIKSFINDGNQKLASLFGSVKELLSGNLERVKELPLLIRDEFKKTNGGVNQLAGQLREVSGATASLINQCQQAIEDKTENVGEEIIGRIEDGIKSNSVLKEVEDLKNKLRQSAYLLELTALFNSRFEDFINKYKVPEAADFAFFLDSVSKESKNLTGEQSKYITSLLANKIDETVIGVNNQSLQKTLTILTDLTKRNGQTSEETAKVQKLINELHEKMKAQEDRLAKIGEDNLNNMRGVVTVIQNNVVALAKMIQNMDQGKSGQINGLNQELNRIKKNLEDYYG